MTTPVEPEIFQYTIPAIQKAKERNIKWLIENGSFLATYGKDSKEGSLERYEFASLSMRIHYLIN